MKKLKPYVQTLPGDTETPVTLYRKLAGDKPGILLESCEQPKGRYSFVAAQPEARIRSRGDDVIVESRGRMTIRKGRVLDAAREYVRMHQVSNDTGIPFVGGLVGAVGYDVARQYERLPDNGTDTLGMPESCLMAVTEVVAYDHFHHTIHLIVLEEEDAQGEARAKTRLRVLKEDLARPFSGENKTKGAKKDAQNPPTANLSREGFMERVRKAKAYIHQGDIFQAVLSIRWSTRNKQDPFTLYRRLRQINPSAYLFFMNFGDFQIAGSSPEMLAEVRGDRVRTVPIAGTRPRGASKDEDEALSRELLADEKERAEHVMLVDLGRNDMGRVARIGSVGVSDFMAVKYYSHVMHLVSQVEGLKREDMDMFDVLAAFLPAGTLSGAPKIRAMEIIDELEPVRRGLYGGAAGYFGFDGDMDMCIAIRTLVFLDGQVYLQAGAGIVADSIPENEYEEIRSKVRVLMEALKEETDL